MYILCILVSDLKKLLIIINLEYLKFLCSKTVGI